MYLKRFYDENLAHASYLVGCQAAGEAIVIDPSREVSHYKADAASQGLKIVAVTETHVHADYLSGSRQLSHECGAKMYLSNEGGADWQYQFADPERDVLVGDGDKITVGNLTLEVMHTPGHTPEHISFILTDHPASDQPIGAFTGDFLFVGDVGRPDLLEKAAGIKDTMKKGAIDLYATLQRFSKLPDHLQVWPAHGAGSACGKALGAVPSSVLGYEKIANWAFQCKTEEEFVEKILEGQPEPPRYFAQMKHLNKVGPPVLGEISLPELTPTRFESVVKEARVLDLRGAEAFAQSHPEGVLFLPPSKAMVNWAGWLLDYETDFYLLVKDAESAAKQAAALRSIGLDRARGYFLVGELDSLAAPLRSSRRIHADEVPADGEGVIDVRGLSEWNHGHLEGATHIHLGTLEERLDEVPDQPVLYCGSGVRSLIASSLLEGLGKSPTDVLGGWGALKERKALSHH